MTLRDHLKHLFSICFSGPARRIAKLALGASLTAAALALPAAQAEEPPIDAAQKQAIEQIIRDYLLNNPAVVGEALDNYLKHRDEIRQAEALKALETNLDMLVNEKTAYVVGDPEAPVTIIEFFDYNCGFCRIATPTLMQVIQTNPKVRVVFREFPIRGSDSEAVARAALASRPQGKYLELHQALMAVTDRMTMERFEDQARQFGLDVEEIGKQMADPQLEAIIAGNFVLAEMLNIEGTPSFIVGNRILYGWPGEEKFLKIVDEVVKEAVSN